MIIDRLEGGQGMYIYVCVSMCVPEWGVVDVFTMGNEPISRLPRGGNVGVPVRGMGVAPHLSSSKMWVTSHPRVISLAFS